MKYNPNIHHRRSIRLNGYDYSQAGAYFITLCTQNRACLFGHVVGGKMILNDAGKMVEKWYFELMNKFPDIQCDQYIIMPNHMHFIVINVGAVGAVGANLRVCPIENKNTPGKHTSGKHTSGEHAPGEHALGEHALGEHALGEHVGSPLRDIIRWFKTMTTNEYIRNVKNNGWKPFDGKLWQRNYYEHIIRDEGALHTIRQYIINNCLKWQEDENYLSLYFPLYLSPRQPAHCPANRGAGG